MNTVIKETNMDRTEPSSPLLKSQDALLPPRSSSGGDTKRGKLVALLRGYFASPVIATLGEMGMVERMLEGDFSASDWDSAPRVEIVSALFRYLHSIGLLTKRTTGEYALTPEGRTSLGRSGAFSLLMSYAEYFHELPTMLATGEAKPSVNRRRNVHGSGQLHSRKFFPAAFDFLSSGAPTALIDIGCGDGRFLALARERWPDLAIFGVDLSETAVEQTRIRLSPIIGSGSVAAVANGYDVAIWSEAVPENVRRSPQLVISMWFVGHEFSEGSAAKMVAFFSEVYARCPQAQLILGEIDNIPAETLAEDHDLSIMPEFLLFHELSGQGVLSWNMWLAILDKIPYDLKADRRFDEVRSRSGEQIPASFVWLLAPKAPTL
jgi:SAM-dependent methyltransferase